MKFIKNKFVSIIVLLWISSISLLFAQNKGYLSVESTPSGASVYIDGQYIGNAPIKLISISSGRHILSVSYDNYETESINVHINPDEVSKQTIILKKVEGFKVKPGETDQIKQQKGKLTIITEPDGATVYIDGKIVGEETPFTVEELGAGKHNIKIVKYMGDPLNDRLRISKEVNIKANKTELLRINLNDYIKEGTLIINSNEYHKNVTIKNLFYGKTYNLSIPSSKDLLVGDYKIYWNDDSEMNLNFSIISGSRTNIFIPFKEKYIPIKPVIGHPDYVTFDEYYNKMYSPLPEKNYYKYIKFEWNRGVTAGLVLALVGTTGFIDGSTTWVVVGSIFVGLGIYGIIRGFSTKTASEPIQENINNNAQKKISIKSSYEILYKKWLTDIEKEDVVIKQNNLKIKKKNNLLLPPSVRYKEKLNGI